MNNSQQNSSFFTKMGILLLSLVIAGFGAAAIVRRTSPLELPLLFHIHGLVYIAWFLLFIFQTKLITGQNYDLHKKLGYSSILIVLAMLVTGLLMTAGSYDRGASPIPGMTVQQFLVFPLLDLVGLILFYVLGILNRHNALTHKHAMLLLGISIIDPGIARIGLVIGFPPLILALHIGLVVLVILHDRKTYNRVHPLTWLCLAFVIVRPVFIMTVGTSESWANLMNSVFG